MSSWKPRWLVLSFLLLTVSYAAGSAFQGQQAQAVENATAGAVVAVVGGSGVNSAKAPISSDLSTALVESTMQRYPGPKELGSWGYAKSLYLFGQYLVFKRTEDPRYLSYIKNWIDSHVDENGKIDRGMNALDYMLPGNLLLVLYKETGEPKYKIAAESIRQRFDTYPRTKDGGLWHATSRQHQLWADGLFMSMPFLVRYGQIFGDSKYANDEAANQLLIYASHLRDPRTGLFYHAYDESGAQKWANPTTHRASEFWCRAMGWYAMALVDVLEVLPKDHPKRAEVLATLQEFVKSIARYQDSKTGLWYQVIDQGADPNNWLETSSSSMFTYVISLSVERGYVSQKYAKVASKGYRGVMTKLTFGEDGLTNISDICEGTNVSDRAYYFGRKRPVNDFHGLGAFLLMNEHAMTAKSSIELDGREAKTKKKGVLSKLAK
ncbi:MAG TPA: glycoside hydrolase family 88 protein [Clostridia bacterium]|nr:glycoside hydrolase family 88 protein [Clostridia bacterium]